MVYFIFVNLPTSNPDFIKLSKNVNLIDRPVYLVVSPEQYTPWLRPNFRLLNFLDSQLGT